MWENWQMKEKYISYHKYMYITRFIKKNKEINVWTLQTHSIYCKLTAKIKIHLSTENAIKIIIARDQLNIYNDKKNIQCHVSWYEIYIP